jgi:hypothetical protein
LLKEVPFASVICYQERYGKGRWRKKKGTATVKLKDGSLRLAEIHWYEAHGIGRRDIKIKFPFLD